MTVPGGLYNTSWFLVMNEAKWDEIGEEDRAAIEAISGAAFAERVGQAWNDADTAAIAEIEEAGIVLYPASDAVLDAVRTAADAREAEWDQSLGTDYDGLAALARLRELSGVVE